MERDYRKDYEELISKLKTILDSQTNETISIDSIREVIPELSESKDNIENRLINAIKSSAQLENCLQKHGFKIKEILNWLEKQIERKSDVRYRYLEELLVADDIYQMAMNDAMVEEAKGKATSAILKLCVSELLEFRKTDNSVRPRFKTGDWVIVQGKTLYQIKQVTELSHNHYQYWTTDEHWFGDGTEAKLWTIQDAKDGDVLAEHETIVLFKKIEGQNIRCYCTYHYLGFNPTFYVGTLQNKNHYCPATKEQHDLLFSKMKETGYEWDAEKKELRTIEHKPGETELNSLAFLTELGYTCIPPTKGKPNSWSEDDEYQINTILHGLDLKRELYKNEGNQVEEKRYKTQYDWLKSIKDRVQPQSKQEWSEEDEEIRKELITFLKEDLETGGRAEETWSMSGLERWIAWLEKQQDNNEDSNILQRFSFYSYKDEPNILYLSGLYVNEECRNKGIGTKILEVAEKVAKSLNCHAIRLKTKKDSNAERLYRAHGYNSLATEERDEIWLEKQDEKIYTWSEEDEKIINDAIWLIEHYATDGHKKLLREQTIDKLKSLKPQNHWKPSEEQLRAIINCVQGLYQCKEKGVLLDLYEQLKNL